MILWGAWPGSDPVGLGAPSPTLFTDFMRVYEGFMRLNRSGHGPGLTHFHRPS